MITHALPRKKQHQPYIMGEIHSHVLTIPKLKYLHLVAQQTAKHRKDTFQPHRP
jgi:hypothetical protein